MNSWIEIKAKRLFSKIKARPYLWGFWSAAILLSIPIIVWVLYFIGDNYFVLIHTSLTVGDALGFYASLLAFVGTIVLGAIAVWQNLRLQKLEENASIRDRSCNILLENFTDEIKQWSQLSHEGPEEYPASTAFIRIKAKNFSDAFLKAISIQFDNIDVVFTSHVTIANGEYKYLKIMLPVGVGVAGDTKCKITFISCYNIKTYGDFSTYFETGSCKAKIKHYHFYGNQDVKL